MANRLEIAFIASPALLLVTANEVGQTFTRHFMPVPLEQPRGVGARGGPSGSPALTKPPTSRGSVPSLPPWEWGQRAGWDQHSESNQLVSINFALKPNSYFHLGSAAAGVGGQGGETFSSAGEKWVQ